METIIQTAALYGSTTLMESVPKVFIQGDCWIWTGRRNLAGYGIIQVDKAPRCLSRVILQEMLSPLPSHIFACHECDTPPCINPEHLFAGTHTDNMLDCSSKGRHKAIPPLLIRLSRADAEAIREDFKSGMAKRAIARKYVMSDDTVRRVIKYKELPPFYV